MDKKLKKYDVYVCECPECGQSMAPFIEIPLSETQMIPPKKYKCTCDSVWSIMPNNHRFDIMKEKFHTCESMCEVTKWQAPSPGKKAPGAIQQTVEQ